MGEISEMMLDGTLCEVCGGYIGSGSGFPRRCAGCERDDVEQEKIQCPHCNRRVKKVGLLQHVAAKHPGV